jgi:hypothetical protein
LCGPALDGRNAWANVQASAKLLAAQGNIAEALQMYRRGSLVSAADRRTTVRVGSAIDNR